MYVLDLLNKISFIFPLLFLYTRWQTRAKEFGGLETFIRKNPYLMASELLLAIGWLYLDLCFDKKSLCIKIPGWSKLLLFIGIAGLLIKAMQGPGQRKKFTGIMLLSMVIAIVVPA